MIPGYFAARKRKQGHLLITLSLRWLPDWRPAKPKRSHIIYMQLNISAISIPMGFQWGQQHLYIVHHRPIRITFFENNLPNPKSLINWGVNRRIQRKGLQGGKTRPPILGTLLVQIIVCEGESACLVLRYSAATPRRAAMRRLINGRLSPNLVFRQYFPPPCHTTPCHQCRRWSRRRKYRLIGYRYMGIKRQVNNSRAYS